MNPVRDRVRRRALELFGQHGYAGASLRDIAAAVGVTPAAVYYHYRAKDDLLDDLLDPLLGRAEHLLTELERAGGPVDPRQVLSRLFDVLLADREVFRWASADVAIAHHPRVGPRITALNDQLARLLGSGDQPVDRVATSAALGVLLRPLARRPEEPVARFREALIDGALYVRDLAQQPRHGTG